MPPDPTPAPPLPTGTWRPDVHRGLQAMLDAPPTDGRPVAVFDWDDTIIEGDVSLALLRAVDAEQGTTWHDDYFALLASGGRDVAYPQITRWFAGHTAASFDALAHRHVHAALARGEVTWRPDMVALVRAMQARGWDLWIVSASPAAAVCALAAELDIAADHVLAMRLEPDPDGRLSERVVEPATYCDGKRLAVLAHVGPHPTFVAGDSRSDADMMGLAARALLVDGHDADLRAEARARGWWIQGGWRHTPAEPGVRVADG
ncbi:MAG: haloacid dehalogenase-like hydrolase [Alphaproteobacteria bacterium]|nr:haloacid dehalogenase-like hydrolase [Alphaproteobacteria bacterium]